MTSPDARVELQIGGVWTAVTGDTQDEDTIRYTWGRRAEGSVTDPSSVSVVLRNEDGRYTSRNPLSPYYGLLGRNTPLRLSHGGANVALVLTPAGDGQASTADNAALDITGDIDVRADLTPSQWGGTTESGEWDVMGKWGGLLQVSWGLFISDAGAIRLEWSPDGITMLRDTSTRPVSFAPGQRGAVRATLDVNNGAAGHTTTFYVASTLAGPWTQLGDPVVTAGTTSIFNSTASLQVGNITVLASEDIGREYHSIEVRSGIGGSAVANPNFAAQASGVTGFTDAAGRSWSITGGSQITSRRTRAVLEASEWVPRWTAGGRDVTAPIQAAGILRRLGQGNKPLASALRRRLPTADPIAYWPLEDGQDATQAASPITGCPPLRVADFSFAQDDSCPGSSSLPSVGDAATMQARVPAVLPLTGWTISMVYQLDSAPASTSPWLAFTATGTAAHGIVLNFTSPNVVIDFYDASGVLITSTSFSNAGLIGANRWIRVDFTADFVGPNTDFTATFVATDGSTQALSTTSLAGTTGIVEDIATAFGTQLSGMNIGHLAVFDTPNVDIWNGSESGYDGETSGARLLRLGSEENVPVSVASSEEVATQLGPQRPNPLVTLLREVEDADGGILYEDRERLGLVLRTRSSLFNQTPKAILTYSQLVAPLEPTDDDRYLRNDRTVSRTKGSSARAVLTSGALSTAAPPSGVGLYDDSETLNVHSDTQLEDIAWWKLHLGTWDEARYPKLRILLHKHPSLIPTVRALRPGDVIRITGLPAWLPPGPLDLMVEGGDEVLTATEWVVDLACSPAGMWSVAVADDTVPARADTAGSQLASGISSSATSLSVTVTTGELWTTAGAEFPFDIRIGGEVMTLSGISGASSPQTFTVSARSVNGIVKAHLANAAVELAYPTYTSY